MEIDKVRIDSILFIQKYIFYLQNIIKIRKHNQNHINQLKIFIKKYQNELNELLDILINIVNSKNFHKMKNEYKNEVWELMMNIRLQLQD